MKPLATLAVLAFLSGCSPLAADTNNRITDMERRFPLGTSLTDAEMTLTALGLPHTVFTRENCENNAKITSPTYTPKGGPCAFAMSKVGHTWYGYVVDLQVRLFFDSANILVHREFDRVDTFI